MYLITYTPQEMLAKRLIIKEGGASALCMYRDFIVVSVNGTGWAQHVNNMNKYLGLE